MRDSVKGAVLSIAAAALLGIPGITLACSCARTATSEVEEVNSWLKSSDAVVLAEAISVEVFPSNTDEEKTETQRVRWKIINSWKGAHAKNSVLVTETIVTCCMCGVRVIRGQQFLLFRYKPEPFSISNCSLSGVASERRAQIALLNELTQPLNKTIERTR